MRTREQIIDYLGLDKQNHNEKWFNESIEEANLVEIEHSEAIKANEIGYSLNCYYNSNTQREFLEDLSKYTLETKSIHKHITVYRKIKKEKIDG